MAEQVRVPNKRQARKKLRALAECYNAELASLEVEFGELAYEVKVMENALGVELGLEPRDRGGLN